MADLSNGTDDAWATSARVALSRPLALNPRSPAPKQRGASNAPPRQPRHQRQHRQGHLDVLKLLAAFVVMAALAQFCGMGTILRRALLSRCVAIFHEDYNYVGSSVGNNGTARGAANRAGGHGAGVWGHLCAEMAAGPRGAAPTTAAPTAALGNGRMASRGTTASSSASRSSSMSAGFFTVEGRGGFETAAAVAAASSYHPAEWPRVYGGRAEPHKRILRRCTGGLFSAPLGPSSRPEQSLVGVWLPQHLDLAFCDSKGRSTTLRMRPITTTTTLAIAAATSAAATGGDGESSSSSDTGNSSSSTNSNSDQGHASAVISSSETGSSTSSRSNSSGSSKNERRSWFEGLLPHPSGRTLASKPEERMAEAGAAWGEEKEGAVEEPHRVMHTLELATSRALVADGGSVRIAWADGFTLLGDGVAAKLESKTSEGSESRSRYRTGSIAILRGICPGGVDAQGGGGGGVVSCVTLDGREATDGPGLEGTLGRHLGEGGGGGGGTGGGLHWGRLWRSPRSVLLAGSGGERDDGGEGVRVRSWRRSVAAAEEVTAAPATVVLATVEDRMVVRLVMGSEDVAAAAREAAALVRSADVFTRRLETAVVSSYEALRTVPHDIGLQPGAPAEDKRLSRKLYDLMSLNTAPGWSTPDRTPHGRQWLWDSCFHALGMNLVNHTLAWEQLKGFLRCQQPDGFLPHICSRGGGGGGAGGGGEGSSAAESHLTQPPLLAWAVWDNYLFARDKRRLEWALPRIVRLLEWLARHRSRDGGLTFFYVHGFESGMDNSPRFDGTTSLTTRLAAAARDWTRDPRVGTCTQCTPHLLSVDLCALVAREMALVGRMMRELGRDQEADSWASRSHAVAAALLSKAWNPERKMYGDVLHKPGSLLTLLGSSPRRHVSDLVTAAGLLPLLAGQLPSEHLSGLLGHLKDPNSFATPVPLPSVAVSSLELSDRGPSSTHLGSSSPSMSSSTSSSSYLDMWRGPMWVNINYLVAVGLREQVGCRECDRLAAWIVRSTIAEVRKWYDGGVDEDDDHDHHQHHHHDLESHHQPQQHAAWAAPATALGTVFEFYDTYGEVPPTRLVRKGLQGAGSIRDYHWTAALTLRMMAEEAARAAAKVTTKSRHASHVPEWLPGADGRSSST